MDTLDERLKTLKQRLEGEIYEPISKQQIPQRSSEFSVRLEKALNQNINASVSCGPPDAGMLHAVNVAVAPYTPYKMRIIRWIQARVSRFQNWLAQL